MGMGGPYALDMGAVLAMADHMEIRTPLLAEILPDIEAELVTAMRSGDEEGGPEGDAR